MSPTVFRVKDYRFYFFSREEARQHVHVSSSEGEAKFWLEPDVELVMSHGFTDRQLREIGEIVAERASEIREAWKQHLGG